MALVKKVIIIVLIIWGISVFFKKYIAPVMVPFFKAHKDNVGFFNY